MECRIHYPLVLLVVCHALSDSFHLDIYAYDTMIARFAPTPLNRSSVHDVAAL